LNEIFELNIDGDIRDLFKPELYEREAATEILSCKEARLEYCFIIDEYEVILIL
jgi:hypothetical protein